MVYSYVCNGFFADPTWELPTGASRSMDSEKLCNYLQNVGATTYILVLQLSTFLFYNKHRNQAAGCLNSTMPFPGTVSENLPSIFLSLLEAPILLTIPDSI